MLYPESKSDQKLIWSMEFWKSFDMFRPWNVKDFVKGAAALAAPTLTKDSQTFSCLPSVSAAAMAVEARTLLPCCKMLQTESVSRDVQSLLCGFCRAGCELFEAIVTCVTSSVPSISHILLFLEGGSLQTFNLRWTHLSWSGKRPMSNKIIMHHANILQQRAATDFEKAWASCRWKHYMHASVCATISLGLYLRSTCGSPPIVVRQYSSAFFPSSWLQPLLSASCSIFHSRACAKWTPP